MARCRVIYENTLQRLGAWPEDSTALRGLERDWLFVDLVGAIEYIKTLDFYATLSLEDQVSYEF